MNFSTLVKASSPLLATATTRMPPCLSRIRTRPSRTTSWSSTTITLITLSDAFPAIFSTRLSFFDISGSLMLIRVPRPRNDWTVKSPPINSARSRMASRPRWRPRCCSASTAVRSKPRPLSSMVRISWLSFSREFIHTASACECLRTLVRASCRIRKTASSAALVRFSMPFSSTLVLMAYSSSKCSA